MIGNQPAAHTPARQPKKIPIHKRSTRVGDVVIINAHRANHHLLKQRFAEGGYYLFPPRLQDRTSRWGELGDGVDFRHDTAGISTMSSQLSIFLVA